MSLHLCHTYEYDEGTKAKPCATKKIITEEQLIAKRPVLYKQHDTYYDACYAMLQHVRCFFFVGKGKIQ